MRAVQAEVPQLPPARWPYEHALRQQRVRQLRGHLPDPDQVEGPHEDTRRRVMAVQALHETLQHGLQQEEA